MLEWPWPLLHRKPGNHTPTDRAGAQGSTVLPVLLNLPSLVELPVTCDGCCLFRNCGPIAAASSPESQIPRSVLQDLCATEAAETPLQRLLVPKTEGKIIPFNLLPVLPIPAKQSRKCSFQVQPHKRAWKRWEWS